MHVVAGLQRLHSRGESVSQSEVCSTAQRYLSSPESACWASAVLAGRNGWLLWITAATSDVAILHALSELPGRVGEHAGSAPNRLTASGMFGTRAQGRGIGEAVGVQPQQLADCQRYCRRHERSLVETAARALGADAAQQLVARVIATGSSSPEQWGRFGDRGRAVARLPDRRSGVTSTEPAQS